MEAQKQSTIRHRSMRLSFGKFYGDVRRRAEVAGIGLSETVYAADARLPRHEHESLYFCLVLRGSYEELDSKRQRQCDPATLVFHPAGEAHSNRFGGLGGACFNMEFSAAWNDRIRPLSPLLTGPANFADAAMVALAVRLRHEFHSMDDLSVLAIESLALDIIVSSVRRGIRGLSYAASPPVWLKRAEELIRAQFAERLTLNEIAVAISRHPVHLAREFRAYYGCTIGDYVRRLRLDKALRRLAETDEPLVAIALGCGFSGQAHFSTVVKRATGLSPKHYRETFRLR